MRRNAIKRGGTDYSSRAHCRACNRHRQIAGHLSRRGLCETCGAAHQVAQWLGLTSVVYEVKSITDGIRSVYAGPVIEPGGFADTEQRENRMIS